GFQLKDSQKLYESLTINVGYQFDEVSVGNRDEINNPSFSRNVTEVLLTHAFIGEGVFETLDHKTFVQAGFRANYFEKFNMFVPEPRLQFSQQLFKNLRLEILGEQKSQTLSQIIDLQNDFLGIEKRRWTLANEENIPIQKSSQLSIGFVFKNKNWLISVDNFYKRVLGITSSGQGFQNQFEYIRATGDYRVLGTELLVQKNFKRFYTWLSYTYNDNEYQFDQFSATSFSNNFELPHTFSWAGIYEWRQLKVALGSKWHSGRPVTTPATNAVDTSDPVNPSIIYNKANNANLDNYFQLNFSASREWDLGANIRLQTSVALLNILNNRNVINLFYRVNPADNTIESVKTYSLGRTPDINIRLTF
ncbi:MAG TPA: TonB-dependent receptor, partial [Flavobacterium sp.]